MPRIFGYLCGANFILILATAGLGFFDPADSADRHVLLAVITLLLACLIQVLAFTYLTVTGKIVVQAVHLGRLDAAAIEQSKALKRRLTRTLASMVVIVVLVTATGAAAWRSGNPHTFHLPATFLFLAIYVAIFMREYNLLSENAQLVERTLTDYARTKAQPASA